MGPDPGLSAPGADGPWKEHRSPLPSLQRLEQEEICSLRSSKPHTLHGHQPVTDFLISRKQDGHRPTPEGGSRVTVWPWEARAPGRNPPTAWSEDDGPHRLKTPRGRTEPQALCALEQRPEGGEAAWRTRMSKLVPTPSRSRGSGFRGKEKTSNPPTSNPPNSRDCLQGSQRAVEVQHLENYRGPHQQGLQIKSASSRTNKQGHTAQKGGTSWPCDHRCHAGRGPQASRFRKTAQLY